MSRLAIVTCSICLVPAAARGQVQVNSDAPGTVQNEVRITQNPTDSSNFVVAYNDKAGSSPSPLGISFSLDGGATWADRQLGTPTHPILMSPDDGIALDFIFDPFIDSDSSGNIFAGYIATDGSGGGPGGIYIERSADKGQTWSGPQNIDFDTRAAAGPPPNPDPYRFNDRPDMTVDGSDHVYVVWIKDVGQGNPTSDIWFAKSPPASASGGAAGLDFTGTPAGSVAPKTINDNPGGMPTPSDFANVPDVAVAANGTIYVSWIDVDVTNASSKPGTLYLDVSTDGGMTFGSDRVAQSITALASNMSTASGSGDDVRSGSYPVIATDPASSSTVYMAYAAVPGGSDEADIYFTKTTDSGTTWSAPIRVNDDATTNDQIHPMMAVKGDGTIDVVWYDKRNAANDDMWDVYAAKSTDGGGSFSANVRVTPSSFATPTDLGGSPWFGEYLGLELDSTTAYFAYTSSANDGKGDCFFTSLANSSIPVELLSFTIR